MRGGGEKTARLGVLSCLLLTTCYTGDQSRKIEMGGACGTYGGEAYTGFWCGNLREITTWETRT